MSEYFTLETYDIQGRVCIPETEISISESELHVNRKIIFDIHLNSKEEIEDLEKSIPLIDYGMINHRSKHKFIESWVFDCLELEILEVNGTKVKVKLVKHQGVYMEHYL